jgi:prepilin-type N-terminal cleavage/methylation domain-containing protein
MKKEKGFSLVELLIVIAIIGIVAGIAIPALRLAKYRAESGSAIQSLRMITTAQHIYEGRHKVYADLPALAPEATVDTNIASGHKSGYSFVVTLGPGAKSFSCTATPDGNPANRDFYFVDVSGVIRVESGIPATAASAPIPR